MALWVCAGPGGCGTKYAVGLFRCPRCHNEEFHEDGDPVAKISRYGGASDKTLPAPEVEAVEAPPTRVVKGEPGPELVDVPEGAVVYAVEQEEEEGEESSPGSSSSVSTGLQQTTSEPSGKRSPSPAPMTGSRSKRGRTGSRSAGSTGGGRADGTSAADDEGEA